MIRNLIALAFAVAIVTHTTTANGQVFQVLHSFPAPPAGGTPTGSLIQSGNQLYGMDTGEIFSFDTVSRTFSSIHTFTGGPGDGAGPEGSLILSGQTLYGLTNAGGSVQASNGNYVYGTLFAFDTVSNSISILHSFADSVVDGAAPHGTPNLAGSVLYGMTGAAGAGSDGTIFSYDTVTHAYSTLHSLAGAPTDGKFPQGNLVKVGTTLYGMSQLGGSTNLGTLFSFDLPSSKQTLLHSFTGGATDGASPLGSLLQSGNTLYGMSHDGGTSNLGTIFSYDLTSGTETILHSFAGGVGDGANPWGSLVQFGNILYGMTRLGGSDVPFTDSGIVFAFDLSTNSLSILHTFTPSIASTPALSAADPNASLPIDGSNPNGDLLLVGNTLYGMTQFGTNGAYGTIFSITLPEPSSLAVLVFGASAIFARRHAYRKS